MTARNREIISTYLIYYEIYSFLIFLSSLRFAVAMGAETVLLEAVLLLTVDAIRGGCPAA